MNQISVLRSKAQTATQSLVLLALISLSAPLYAAEVAVEVLANRFLPEAIEVSVGDVVTFTVVEGQHQLEAESATPITGLPSGSLRPGETFALTITDPPGEYFFVSLAEENLRGGLSILDQSAPYAIDNRISSGWFNPAASGQGLLFEYVPASNVLVAYWFTFDFSNSEQLWLIGTGEPVDNQVTMEMVSATGGVMNASNPVNKPVWGELTVDFTDCERATAWFNASNAQQSGQIPLDRLYLTSLCDQE